MITCFEMPAEDFWALEFVATQPKYRGRGLMLALLKRAMERGAAAGFKEARISYFIGNQPAEQTYIRAGLKPAGERRSWDFEAAFGPPGVRYATRRLDG